MSFRVAAGARAALGQNSLPWKAVSYNCQCLTGRRGIGTIVRALSASVVGCQGTRLSARKQPGILPASWKHQWKETQQGYNIMHWTRRKVLYQVIQQACPLHWKLVAFHGQPAKQLPFQAERFKAEGASCVCTGPPSTI